MRWYPIFAAVVLTGCAHAPLPPALPAPTLAAASFSTPSNVHYTVRAIPYRGTLPPILGVTHDSGENLEAGSSNDGWAWANGRLVKTKIPAGIRPLRVNASGGYLTQESGALVFHALGKAAQTGISTFGGAGLNSEGAVVGQAETGRSRSTKHGPRAIIHAFLWLAGHRTDLGALPADEDSTATDINDNRQVIGTSDARGFLWEAGAIRDLGMLPGFSRAVPMAINRNGQVLGRCEADQNTGYAILGSAYIQPFLWNKGTLKALPVPSGSTMVFPVGLSDDGTGAGFVFSRTEPPVPLVWRDGKVFDLNDLIPQHGGWRIWKPIAISAAGDILALARGATDNPSRVQPRLVLLTPAAGPPGEAATRAVVDGQGGAVPIPGRSKLIPISAKPSPPAALRYKIIQLRPEQVDPPIRFNSHGQVAGGGDGGGFFFLDGGVRHDITGQVSGALDVSQVTEDGMVLLRGRQGAIVWKSGRSRTVPNTQFQPVLMNARGDILVQDGPEWIHDGKPETLFGPDSHGRSTTTPAPHRNSRSRPIGYDMNASGQVVGTVDGRAILWTNGKPRDLGVLPGYQGARAEAINNRGQIAGVAVKDADLGYATLKEGYAQPFLWENGKMRLLESLPGCPSVHLLGMNDRGDIIGTDRGFNGGTLIVWLNGHPYNIANLASGDLPWHLDSLQDINAKGEILALGQPEADVGRKGVESYLLLLQPQPYGNRDR